MKMPSSPSGQSPDPSPQNKALRFFFAVVYAAVFLYGALEKGPQRVSDKPMLAKVVEDQHPPILMGPSVLEKGPQSVSDEHAMLAKVVVETKANFRKWKM
jgi:hypothetical protein